MSHSKFFHPKDIEMFSQYPQPLLESLHCQHYTNVNATIAMFGPMLYFLARALKAQNILEIGHAEGYTAFYLAHAVKDNNTRFGVNGRYYGIDIHKSVEVQENMDRIGLPATAQIMDSMTLKPNTFGDTKFDIIFQDGAHDDEHVMYELNIMYDRLKGNGEGFWLMHDCYGPSENAFELIKDKIKEGVFQFEYVRLPEIYGLAIMRKMDGYDHSKRYWKD